MRFKEDKFRNLKLNEFKIRSIKHVGRFWPNDECEEFDYDKDALIYEYQSLVKTCLEVSE